MMGVTRRVYWALDQASLMRKSENERGSAGSGEVCSDSILARFPFLPGNEDCNNMAEELPTGVLGSALIREEIHLKSLKVPYSSSTKP